MDIKVFENSEFGSVRTVLIDGEPYFVGKDVAEILGYKRQRDAISRHVDDEDKGAVKFSTPGGVQDLTVINESGMYNLVLSSKMPNANKFKRWVTSEILPSIRKHGAYMTPEKLEEVLLNPDTLIRLATELKEEREQRKQAEAKIEADKPKVLFADAVSASDTSILVGEMAKILKQNGVDMGQNRLFKYLRDNGYLMKGGSSKNMPTQRSMELGLFEVKETTIANPDGSIRITKTPKLSGKGQIYFMERLIPQEVVQ